MYSGGVKGRVQEVDQGVGFPLRGCGVVKCALDLTDFPATCRSEAEFSVFRLNTKGSAVLI